MVELSAVCVEAKLASEGWLLARLLEEALWAGMLQKLTGCSVSLCCAAHRVSFGRLAELAASFRPSKSRGEGTHGGEGGMPAMGLGTGDALPFIVSMLTLLLVAVVVSLPHDDSCA